MFKKQSLLFDESGAGGGSAPAQPDAATQQEGETLTFDTWYGKQDETIKGLLEGHTKGLKSALDSERETRKVFEKQVKELAVKAEKGSEAEKHLTALSEQLDLENKRAAFYEQAYALGVIDIKSAFVLATSEQLFDKKGNLDVETFRTRFSYMLKTPIPKGNAGDGAQASNTAQSMNDLIRRAAGR